MKRTQYANLVLVSQEDLNDTENYRVQGIKERFGAIVVGYDKSLATAQAHYGVVKEPVDLKFSGTEDTEYTSNYFTLLNGTAFTRFNEATDLTINDQYDGWERLRVPFSQNVTIKHNTGGDVNNYIFLVYVELKKNKKFDESGANAYFVDREDAYVVCQLTASEVNTLGKFVTNPTGSVTITNVTAPHLDALLNNDEKTYTFGGWSNPGGIFTIGSITLTHYNSVFLGKVTVTNLSPIKYKFYHTLSLNDPISGFTLARPAFSIVDDFHRNRMGNGIESDTNPHGLSLTDLGTYNDTVVDHRNLHHSSGITPKFTTSLECVINGTTTPDSLVVTSIAGGEYLFLQGKRVTSVTNLVSFSGSDSAGTYFIYVQDSGNPPTISDVYPYESYTGNVLKTTAGAIPAGAFILCSVYWDGAAILTAYQSDPRYNAASTTNPVTDMRVFGVLGYDKVHTNLFESGRRANLIPFGDFEVSEKNVLKGWDGGTPAPVLPASGTFALSVTGTDNSLVFPFDANIDNSFRCKLQTSGSTNYQINLILCRGKHKTRDRVGVATIPLASGVVTYGSWTLIESEFLSTSGITWDGAFTDRNAIGYAFIQITVSSGTLYVDNVFLYPKVRTVDLSNDQVTEPKIAPDAVSKRTLNADTAGYALAQDVDGSLKVVADEVSLTVDTSNDSVKIKPQGVTTSHVDPASEIGRVAYNGATYLDSVNDSVGQALRIAFGGTTYYIPSSTVPGGVGCGCTCTCTCTCTGTCGCTSDCYFNS